MEKYLTSKENTRQWNEKDYPRIMLAAPASGSGKTMISCGLLMLLKRRMKVAAFKCGPDYIDPMYHKRFLGIPSRNLDTFFTDPETTRGLMKRSMDAVDADIALIEGVMGYYDGLGGLLPQGSSYDLAMTTETPVILVVNTRGMSLSVVALIQGYLSYKENSGIKGVILNQCSGMLFDRLKPVIESELGIAAIGYVPKTEPVNLKSRHLGLVLPSETEALDQALEGLADLLEKTIDVDKFIAIANESPLLSLETAQMRSRSGLRQCSAEPVRIAVAMDEAFCFYYEDNLDLLRELGAEIVWFSPLKDEKLPENIHGLYMGGGYPELHGEKLAANSAMLRDIRLAIDEGLPTLAECGAFMYLHETMEDAEGMVWPMVGAVPGKCFKTPKLVRFGYTMLTAEKKSILGEAGMKLPAHEFHYWDTDCGGDVFRAEKPVTGKTWSCMYSNEKGNLLAGFPHLYFYGCRSAAENFVSACYNRKSSSAKDDRPCL